MTLHWTLVRAKAAKTPRFRKAAKILRSNWSTASHQAEKIPVKYITMHLW